MNSVVELNKIISRDGIFTDGDWIESKDQDPDGSVRLIQLADIGVNKFLDKSNRYLTREKAIELNCTFLKKGDILVARMPDPIGRACIFPELNYECVTVVDVCVIRADNPNVDNGWLIHLINSKSFNNQILTYVTGTTRQRISRGNLAKLKIPLPPLEEQKRIAAILDKADAIRQKRQQAIELVDEFLRSVFLDMFGDPVTNPKGWEERELKTIAEIRSGVTKGKKIDLDKAVSIPYMRVANVQDGYLDLSDIQEILVPQSDADKFKLCSGDILLTEGGDPDKLGRGHIWNNEIPNCIHQNHIFSVRVNNHKEVIPEFLSAVISSQRGKRYFLKVGKQTTGIATINKTVLSEFVPIIPPIELQNDYLKILKKHSAGKLKLIKALADQSSLFNSISKKAFSGQL